MKQTILPFKRLFFRPLSKAHSVPGFPYEIWELILKWMYEAGNPQDNLLLLLQMSRVSRLICAVALSCPFLLDTVEIMGRAAPKWKSSCNAALLFTRKLPLDAKRMISNVVIDLDPVNLRLVAIIMKQCVNATSISVAFSDLQQTIDFHCLLIDEFIIPKKAPTLLRRFSLLVCSRLKGARATTFLTQCILSHNTTELALVLNELVGRKEVEPYFKYCKGNKAAKTRTRLEWSIDG